PLPPARAALLRDRAATGPWIEEWQRARSRDPYHEQWREVGLTATVNVPITSRTGTVMALLILGTTEVSGGEVLAHYLSTAIEFGAVAAALLSQALAERHGEDGERARLGKVIRGREFTIVFQPVVALSDGAVVGFEALTRFDDGMPPDARFAEAEQSGLGIALEFATLKAAAKDAARLPDGAWLSVNVSPGIILDQRRLARVLASVGRNVVVELTEHVAVADYSAIRRAVAALPPGVALAVDDAGAGYAGLRHLVELRPSFIKLDMRLVRDVDRDTARQALIAGMAHFASSSDCTLIAEGIETTGERDVLRQLGVPLGQGFLLGRPAPAQPVPRPTLAVVRARQAEPSVHAGLSQS
ncbi:MAG TPA: EAL domain-containing protein, partial [Vitreimonas sp.]|nr:EAL domain-containing protein [Vitreimonas sp.]